MEKTPLTKIFRGNLRTRTFINNYQQNDYIEPFFTLKLDIKVGGRRFRIERFDGEFF